MDWSPETLQSLKAWVEATEAMNFLGGVDYALRGIHDFESSRKADRP